MSEINSKKYSSQIINILFIGIIIGFIYGLIKSIIFINANKYFSYKLYNLILFHIQENLTTYTIIGLLITTLIVLTILASRSSYLWLERSTVTGMNRYYYVLFMILLIIVLFSISYFFFVDIVELLKSNSITKWLGNFSNSKEETYQIFITTLGVIFFLIIVFISSFIWQRSIEKILKKINLSAIRITGITLICVLSLYNIIIFGYKSLNTPERPNVIIISLDTVRADHLGSYGHKRDTTPNIDNLAKQGVLFENAFSQAPWTLPTMVSIHTSLYPSEHGALNGYSKMNENFVTIAEYLNNNFYKTIGVISQHFVSSIHGFSQGFEIFDEKYISGLNDVSSKSITERAISYIENNQSQSFFLWVHYFDPHHAYIDHKEFDYGSSYTGALPRKLDLRKLNQNKSSLNEKDIEYVKNIYDEELSFTDKYIGELIDSLNEYGLEDNTIIIITADHGEEFLERARFGHGKNLYQELIHVPLIIYVPGESGLRGKRIKSNVEIRSLPYTILELIGIENYLFGGINILSLPEQDTSAVFSEGSYAYGEDHRKEGIIYKNWKLIKNLDDQTYELYDLENDPFEKRNIIEEHNILDSHVVGDLKSRLSNFKKERAVESEKVKFNKEDIERLKALGYIQ